jgi:hypothetical protein
MGCGTVFKVDTTGHESVLYNFCSALKCMDGVAVIFQDVVPKK